MSHAMLDLETMGNGNNAAIAAIGACVFDPHEELEKPGGFYVKVDLASSMAAGMQVDASTILWWMEQSDAARKSTFGGTGHYDLSSALLLFNEWLKGERVEFVWGNGATFDNVIIRSAYKAVALAPAWHFRGDKCYRTVINLLPNTKQPAFDRVGTAHNALDDACTQARHLQKVYKVLGL